MVGEELLGAAAIGKAATGAAKALASSDREEALLVEAAKTEQFHDAAVLRAKREVVKQQVFLKIVQPIGMLAGLSADYFKNDFDNDLTKKLADVPEEFIVSPRPSVAVPAIEGLGLVLEEPDLKDLFLTLIASASDSRTNEADVHPSFVHLIPQLGNSEAFWLKRFLATSYNQPIARVVLTYESGATKRQEILWGTTDAEGSFRSIPNISVYLDNWIRLNLVNAGFTNYLTREGAYDWVTHAPEYAREVNDQQEGPRLLGDGWTPASVGFDKGILSKTVFGMRFATAVGITATPHHIDLSE